MMNPDDKAGPAPDPGAPDGENGNAAPPNAGGRYQEELRQAISKGDEGITPLVDITQEERGRPPPAGLQYSVSHAAALIAAIVLAVAFFSYIGE